MDTNSTIKYYTELEPVMIFKNIENHLFDKTMTKIFDFEQPPRHGNIFSHLNPRIGTHRILVCDINVLMMFA